MRRTLTRLSVTAAAALAAALGTAVPAVAASPVTQPDTMTMYANTVAEIPALLANDTDEDGDDLAICRIAPSPDPDNIEIIDFLGIHLVATSPEARGTYEFTYYACDWETLTPGTLTVTVKPTPAMKVKVTKMPRKPGRVKIVNKNNYPIDFMWGHAAEASPDGTARLKAKKSKVVKVRRKAVMWMATNTNNGAERVGHLKGIKLPKKVKKLPPSPRPYVFGTTWAGVASTSVLDQFLTTGTTTAPWYVDAQR